MLYIMYRFAQWNHTGETGQKQYPGDWVDLLQVRHKFEGIFHITVIFLVVFIPPPLPLPLQVLIPLVEELSV